MSRKTSEGRTRPGAARSAGTRFIDARRRGLLQGAALAGGAVASGAALADRAPETLPESSPETPASAGYRVTEHVREYYAKARF